LTPTCKAEQQESQDEEIINVGKSQEYEVESAFSEDATSEVLRLHIEVLQHKEREFDIKLSGRNATFREQETQVVH
jgi:hypothetical protein